MKRTTSYVAVFALLVGLVLTALLIGSAVRFDIKGHGNGIFLLHGRDGRRYEVKDDLYVGERDRVIWSLDFDDPFFRLSQHLHPPKPGEPELYYAWDKQDGSGYVRNLLADGTELVTFFGRYLDDDQLQTHGLFVGGGKPASITCGDNARMNETGMAYHDRHRWYHVWCSVNEGLVSGSGTSVPPSRWQFLGSDVLSSDRRSLTLASHHRVSVDGVPLRIDRFASLRAGEAYFVLTIKLTNIGSTPARYTYLYGDEPWVGNYGCPTGNVGWTGNRLIEYETVLDSSSSYAGYYDFGNNAAGEMHTYTGTANFIEWFGTDRPIVFFSATPGNPPPSIAGKVPLTGMSRFIGLIWGPRLLNPGETTTYTLAIGMAGHHPATGFPVKPPVTITPP